MKLHSYKSFMNEARKIHTDVQTLINKMLELLENTASTFQFYHEEIGTLNAWDGSLIGLPVSWDEEDENGPSALINDADNLEAIPDSLECKTAITFGNFGHQRTITQNFNNFLEAVDYIGKGGLEKMLEWYDQDKKNVSLSFEPDEMPDYLRP